MVIEASPSAKPACCGKCHRTVTEPACSTTAVDCGCGAYRVFCALCARRKAAVGIDATSSTAPAWDAPNALGPLPGLLIIAPIAIEFDVPARRGGGGIEGYAVDAAAWRDCQRLARRPNRPEDAAYDLEQARLAFPD